MTAMLPGNRHVSFNEFHLILTYIDVGDKYNRDMSKMKERIV